MKRVPMEVLTKSLQSIHEALGTAIDLLQEINKPTRMNTVTVRRHSSVQTSSKDAGISSNRGKKQSYYKGLEGLPEGAVLTTRIRVGRHRKPVDVQAKISGGKLYIDGRTNGHTSLAKALCSARGLVGAARNGVTTNGIQAWRINGVPVYNYRRMLANSNA